jgi:methylmalonyl-CoA mutase
MMDDAAFLEPLAAGFAPASRGDWLSLAEKTLKGASAASLRSTTADGITLEPLYAGDDAPAPASLTPGAAGWDVRARIAAGGDANARALEALGGGADSLLVESFDGGAELSATLDGVLFEVASVALDAGFAGPAAARRLDHLAKAAPTAKLAFHLDPLGAFAAEGISPGPIETHLEAAANLAAGLAQTYPRASLFLAGGVAAHEAGAPAALEIALAAASALAYAKAMVGAGMEMADAWRAIVLAVSVDAEPLAGVAKLRAARRVWDRMTQACGASAPASLEARSSRRMLARADHWTNLVRLTAAAFAAAVGGAQVVVLDAFTEPLGESLEPLALRQARNIPLILREEARLAAPVDPAAGAWAIEAHTQALARAAWERLNAIEREGGVLAALRSGSIAAATQAGREALQAALAEGRLRLVGVTDYVSGEAKSAGEASPRLHPAAARLPGPDSRCPALAPIRLEDLAT